MIPLFTLALSTALPACVAVEGERILAQDLAAAAPEFASVAPDTPLGYAPAPGTQRIFHRSELLRLASRYEIRLAEPGDVCFERPMEKLTPERVLAAMRAAPGFSEAHVELLEYSHYPVPRGEIEFPPQGLGPVLWRGWVRYAGGRRFDIWARVKLSVARKRVVAAEDLKAGQPIAGNQLQLETYESPLARQAPAQSLELVVGRTPRRRIPAGSPIFASALEEMKDVARGDVVSVEVQVGAAHLGFAGRAESAGRRGDRVSVRNPQSGKTFSAQVVGKGKVMVTQ